MKVHYHLENLPEFRRAVITIGTFDGVHKGHQTIIDAVLNQAKKVDGESILITFHPHPRKIIQPESSLQLINTLEEKISLLNKKGLSHLVIVPFTAEFSNQSPEDYIKDFLVKKFNPHSIIIGYDHHFGKDRKGNYLLLEEQKSLWGYELIEIPKHVLDEIAISSTKIRKALKNSDIESANKLLGYDFFFTGKVIHGDKLGRILGYPTANLVYTDEDKIRLGDGVYAVYVSIENETKKGMLSIGNRLTLADNSPKVEINIFDFNSYIYDLEIIITIHSYLRAQAKFETLEDLKKQLEVDKNNAQAVL